MADTLLQLATSFTADLVAQVNGIFALQVSTPDVDGGEPVDAHYTWVINLKHGSGSVYQPGAVTHEGAGTAVDTTVMLSEATLVDWLEERIEPMTAMMMGLLSVRVGLWTALWVCCGVPGIVRVCWAGAWHCVVVLGLCLALCGCCAWHCALHCVGVLGCYLALCGYGGIVCKVHRPLRGLHRVHHRWQGTKCSC